MAVFVFVLCSGYKLNDPEIPYPKGRSIIRAGRFLLTISILSPGVEGKKRYFNAFPKQEPSTPGEQHADKTV
jgi:hypothetical protein